MASYHKTIYFSLLLIFSVVAQNLDSNKEICQVPTRREQTQTIALNITGLSPTQTACLQALRLNIIESSIQNIFIITSADHQRDKYGELSLELQHRVLDENQRSNIALGQKTVSEMKSGSSSYLSYQISNNPSAINLNIETNQGDISVCYYTDKDVSFENRQCFDVFNGNSLSESLTPINYLTQNAGQLLLIDLYKNWDRYSTSTVTVQIVDKSSSKFIIIGVAVGVSFVFLVFLGSYLTIRNRRRRQRALHGNLNLQSQAPQEPQQVQGEIFSATGVQLPTVKKQSPLTKDEVNKYFPNRKFGKLQSCFPQSSCSICLDDFATEVICRQLYCEHIFHGECIALWLRKHESCPNCNTPITKAAIKEFITAEKKRKHEEKLRKEQASKTSSPGVKKTSSASPKKASSPLKIRPFVHIEADFNTVVINVQPDSLEDERNQIQVQEQAHEQMPEQMNNHSEEEEILSLTALNFENASVQIPTHFAADSEQEVLGDDNSQRYRNKNSMENETQRYIQSHGILSELSGLNYNRTEITNTLGSRQDLD